MPSEGHPPTSVRHMDHRESPENTGEWQTLHLHNERPTVQLKDHERSENAKPALTPSKTLKPR